MTCPKFLLILITLVSLNVSAKVRLPVNLDSSDQIKALKVLGFGTNSKILTDPYPLGGYAGFEAGVEYHTIAVDKLAVLGSTVPEQDFFSYPTITVGKGMYNNIDLFLHFMPFSEGTGISEYGGAIRWGIYQLPYYPVSFALTLNANSTNINDLIITKNIGIDFTAGITSQNIFLYLGSGWIQSKADFIGGTSGVTASQNTEQVQVQDFHYLVGVGVRFSYIFAVAQLDIYDSPTYSFKIGFRY